VWGRKLPPPEKKKQCLGKADQAGPKKRLLGYLVTNRGGGNWFKRKKPNTYTQQSPGGGFFWRNR